MRDGVVPRHYVENERRYGLRVDIKNFSMSADVGREKSLVMLSNSRREGRLKSVLPARTPV